MRLIGLVIACGWLCALSVAAAGDRWGDLRGRVIIEGTPPKLKPLAVLPGVGAVPDESLLVDGKTGGLQNVVIFLRRAPQTIHPELVKPQQAEVECRIAATRFQPHVQLARTGQKVQIRRFDANACAVSGRPIKNIGFDFLLAPGEDLATVEFANAEPLPIEIRAACHPWMKAYWMVVDHPYAAITAPDGSFAIENLPSGTHEFRIWHERAGWLEKRGSVDITTGEVTEWTMRYPLERFQPE